MSKFQSGRFFYQGVPHSFSHEAALAYLSEQSEVDNEMSIIGTNAFSEITSAVASGTSDRGIIPIENSLAGSVHANYDLLEVSAVAVLAEVVRPIHHFLHAPKGATLDSIRVVYSHPKALEQCERFLRGGINGAEPYATRVAESTSHAAQRVSEIGDPTFAAIASSNAGPAYNLVTLAEQIEDHPANFTRFLVIGKHGHMGSEDRRKCSVAFSLPHKPGALAHVLTVLAKHGANLTKVESRPLHGSPFEYRFYADFIADEHAAAITTDLTAVTEGLRVFGWYAPTR